MRSKKWIRIQEAKNLKKVIFSKKLLRASKRPLWVCTTGDLKKQLGTARADARDNAKLLVGEQKRLEKATAAQQDLAKAAGEGKPAKENDEYDMAMGGR